MISYNEALARAKAGKPNWNEEEYIAAAIITWADADYEYEAEIENDGYSDDEFTAWVEENAEELQRFIQSKLSDKIEVMLVNGGQPVYYYIISVE